MVQFGRSKKEKKNY